MRRREFIAGVAGTAVWPLATRAQERVRRIGMVLAIAENDLQASLRTAAFEKGLAEFGWVVGRNIRVDYRYGSGDRNKIREQAAALAALSLDVIVVGGTGTMQAKA